MCVPVLQRNNETSRKMREKYATKKTAQPRKLHSDKDCTESKDCLERTWQRAPCPHAVIGAALSCLSQDVKK